MFYKISLAWLEQEQSVHGPFVCRFKKSENDALKYTQWSKFFRYTIGSLVCRFKKSGNDALKYTQWLKLFRYTIGFSDICVFSFRSNPEKKENEAYDGGGSSKKETKIRCVFLPLPQINVPLTKTLKTKEASEKIGVYYVIYGMLFANSIGIIIVSPTGRLEFPNTPVLWNI